MRFNCRDLWRRGRAALVIVLAPVAGISAAQAACDDTCLTQIADQYRAAYVHHDPKQAPFAAHVRFMGNPRQRRAVANAIDREIELDAMLTERRYSAVDGMSTHCYLFIDARSHAASPLQRPARRWSRPRRAEPGIAHSVSALGAREDEAPPVLAQSKV